MLTCEYLTKKIRDRGEEKRLKSDETENRKQARLLKKSSKEQEKVTEGKMKSAAESKNVARCKTAKNITTAHQN